jgi:hypothetical protein
MLVLVLDVVLWDFLSIKSFIYINKNNIEEKNIYIIYFQLLALFLKLKFDRRARLSV